MAGIYIHIPFCKQACSYCDFHFSTNLKYMDKMVEAILTELRLRKDYFDEPHITDKKIETIYFGGGTPSILPTPFIEKIFSSIERLFEITNNPEITLEANPDDLTKSKLFELRKTPINRLSIGVQSFIERDLTLMNRAHNVTQAVDSIKRAQDMGFDNLTIDLIYGTPGLTDKELLFNLNKVLELQIPHLSCYALTIEDKTLLNHQIKNKIINPPSAQQQANQFILIMDTLQLNDFEHYEISNWCLPQKRAIHNYNYWKGEPYLGIGPSAHSYNGNATRSFNAKNNALYLKQILDNNYQPFIEELSKNQKYNEYILTKLRTIEGVNTYELEKIFGYEYKNAFEKNIKTGLSSGMVNQNNSTYTLTKNGKLFADKIAGDCFIV